MSVQEKEQAEESVDEITTPILSVDENLTTEQRLTDNAVNNILPARYLLDDETADEMFHRVADNVATAEYAHDNGEEFEQWRDEFHDIMSSLQFMPNSPTLMNAGGSLQQLSACFVLEVGDSLTEQAEDGRMSIGDSAKDAMSIFKSGGGVGYTFGFLRPKGAYIESTDSETSGPMQFMRLFDEVCNTVKQGGKRRGAQMAIMPITHPDVGRFAVAKREEGAYSNFNISVGLTDDFIEAVREDGLYELKDPREGFDETFEIVEATNNFLAPSKEDSPEATVEENIWRDHADEIEAWDWDSEKTVSFHDKWYAHFQAAENEGNIDVGEEMALPARFVWDLIIDGAWRNGEPGLFYLDETNRKHSFDVDAHPEYEIHATNPCAEQPLCNYEACNLGHVNLSLMVRDDAPDYTAWRNSVDYDYEREQSAVVDYLNEAIDYEQLDRVVESGTRFLDNVVDMSEFPLDEIDETVNDMRKIGLGVMGWAQMLYQFGIPYGSDESYAAAQHVMGYIDAKATRASHELAVERGDFPAWEDSKYASPMEYTDWFESHAHVSPEEHATGYRMRNHNVTTVAPTGTTSMIADTSGGIEPVYNVAFKKNVGNDIQGADKLIEFDSYFLKTLEHNNINVDAVKEEAAEKMDTNDFDSVQDLSSVPEEIRDVFITTNDLTPRQHGMMQRAFQSAVDSGISKTVNLPNEATHADVHEAYMLALRDDEMGSPIKGLTVYRDGSRETQVLSTGEETKAALEEARKKIEKAGMFVADEDDLPEQKTPDEWTTDDLRRYKNNT